ncbi:MAG: hypothetical protein ABR587_07690 [Candidatus Binatia bacterium]
MADFNFEETLRGLGAWSSGSQHGPGGTGPDFSTLFAPVDPYNRWPILVPFVSVLGAAAVFLLTGVAAASLVVMSFALLVVVFLLSEVFGYEIAMPPGMAR